uniref:Uncharacterized protein n=1 Tax=Haemonchus contortus TaxID=6289 RepID=A0A7I4XWD4_HAECO
MEAIIADQLKAINELYMTIRSMRATALNEERAMREQTGDHGHDHFCHTKIARRNVEPAHSWTEIFGRIHGQAAGQTVGLHERKLLTKIDVLEIRMHFLEQEKPCPIREYNSGMD